MFTFEINVICDKCGAMEASEPVVADPTSILMGKAIVWAQSRGWKVSTVGGAKTLCPDCAKLCSTARGNSPGDTVAP